MALSKNEIETFQRTLGEIDKIISIATAKLEEEDDSMLAEIMVKSGHTLAVLGLFRDDLVMVNAPRDCIREVEKRIKTMSEIYSSIILSRPDLYKRALSTDPPEHTQNEMYNQYEDMFAKAIANKG
jgi:hypothetical protein